MLHRVGDWNNLISLQTNMQRAVKFLNNPINLIH